MRESETLESYKEVNKRFVIKSWCPACEVKDSCPGYIEGQRTGEEEIRAAPCRNFKGEIVFRGYRK